jgi:hypothetical protein
VHIPDAAGSSVRHPKTLDVMNVEVITIFTHP